MSVSELCTTALVWGPIWAIGAPNGLSVTSVGALQTTSPATAKNRACQRRPASLVALSFSTTEINGQMELVERVCFALVDQPIDAVLTLGGLSHIPITPRRNVEVVPFADHDELFPRCEVVVTQAAWEPCYVRSRTACRS